MWASRPNWVPGCARLPARRVCFHRDWKASAGFAAARRWSATRCRHRMASSSQDWLQARLQRAGCRSLQAGAPAHRTCSPLPRDTRSVPGSEGLTIPQQWLLWQALSVEKRLAAGACAGSLNGVSPLHLPLLQDLTRDHPPGRDDVRPLSAVVAECRGPSLRARLHGQTLSSDRSHNLRQHGVGHTRISVAIEVPVIGRFQRR